ncbi:MAG: hypothetical protein IKW99_03725 [Bacteroidales bacterium]|nr:hypothetical protein [Bacteroidales bacterium]
MKKVLVLFVAVCCLFVSCQKEGGSGSVDGTTWLETDTNWPHTLKLKGGYASLYYKDKLYDTQAYSIKGNIIKFKDHLIIEPEEPNPAYYFEGSFNGDKSRLMLKYAWSSYDGSRTGEDVDTFIRVAE